MIFFNTEDTEEEEINVFLSAFSVFLRVLCINFPKMYFTTFVQTY